ncbi:AMP-dependent synthetase/ligase [Nonomuraea sp. NPDC026600]|uniref:AMP-dependent synthetase/ligase n=1 Tax=Nonomuraea sp. NPDC026600 TaxID=3155363 RepID=UPI003400DCDC
MTTEYVPGPAGLDDARSLCDVLLRTAAANSDRLALRTMDGKLEVTYEEALARIRSFVGGLGALGVARGEPVALMLANRPEFHLIDAAAMFLGAVPFSIYNTSPPEQVGYVLSDAGSRVAIIEERFLATVRAAREHGARLDHVVVIDAECDGCLTLADLAAGDAAEVDLEASADHVAGDDLLTLIYTSGTTGPPKGVEITHANMLAQLRGMDAAVPLPGGGRQVSFLPTAHIADRWTSHYSAFMTYANTVTSVAEIQQAMEVVARVRPTIFAAVPRIWEKVKASLEAGFGPDLGAKARATPELAESIRVKLGLDQAQWLVTGAAPTPVEVLEFFDALGLPLCEGLGMSEASCIVATNRPGVVRQGSVGLPLDTVELRLAGDGELFVRGPQVMRGYRNMPERTAEAIDGDGWLHTGDVARIDEDGFVWIVDRKKELIINAAGKNMSPANIEMRLKSAGPLIGQACVIGDRRPYNVALLVLDPVAGADLDPTDLGVVARVREEVDAANTHLARVEQIKRFRLLAGDWSPDGDELTPTMKLKRRTIERKYADEIEALYAQGQS